MAYRVDPNQWTPQNCQQKSPNGNSQFRTGYNPSMTSNEAKMKIDHPPPGVGFVSSSTSGDPIILTCLDGHRTNSTNWPNQSSNQQQTMFSYTKPHEIYGPQPTHPNSVALNDQNGLIVQPTGSNIASSPSSSTTLDGYIPNGIIFNQPLISTPQPTPKNQFKKPKRQRTAITTDQILNLEDEYKKNRYIEKFRRMQLSQMLCINERVIKIWFQNRRMKEKNEKAAKDDDEDVYEVPYIPPSQSDWVTSSPQQIHGRYQYPQIQSTIMYPENNSISSHGSILSVQQELSTQINSTFLAEGQSQSQDSQSQYIHEII